MDDVTAGSDAGARGANCTVRVMSPLMIFGEGRHEIGAFITLPEAEAEELVALGVVEIMPEMPASEAGAGKKKKPA